MAKRITLKAEDRKFVLSAMKVSSVALWKALTYRSDSDLSKRLRQLAMEHGGVVVDEIQEKDPTTLHDSDGWMRQYYANGASVEMCKKDGHAEVWMRGQMVARYENVKVSEIDCIQQMARLLM